MPTAEADDSPEAPFELQLDAAQQAALDEVTAMLSEPSLACAPGARTLAGVLAACAPTLCLADAAGGPGSARGVVTTAAAPCGAELLHESALYWLLARSPGTDAVRVLEDGDGRLLGSLSSWAAIRTLGHTLCVNPTGGGPLHAAARLDGAAEAAYARVQQLTVYGAPAAALVAASERAGGAAPALLPSLPPGLADGPGAAIPRRAQLLHAITRCNGHAATLPPDGNWLRGLLWPLLGRLGAGDRDRLFEDAAPFSQLTAQFAGAALLNHSCEPNCQTSAQWLEGEPAPRAVVIAKRALAAGEECTCSYLPLAPGGGVAARRRELLLSYRFACACARCVREEPRAGTPADPLAAHFPLGAGLDARVEVRRGGALWPREVAAEEDVAGGAGEAAGAQATLALPVAVAVAAPAAAAAGGGAR